MKKTKIGKIGKRGMVIFAVFIAISMIASAAILTSYGEVRTTATAKQSIVFDGKEDNTPVEHEFDVFGGCCKCIKEKIKNRACMEGIVDLDTTYSPDGDGITTTIYQVPEFTTLALNNKYSNWYEIDCDGIEGTLVFKTISLELEGTIDATGLIPNTEYSLIYYADPWAGNHPGAYIGSMTSDCDGIISEAGSTDLGMNLPQEDDENYLLGAKLWLVLAADYDEATCSMTAWNPDSYLFEHELIAYSDCNIEVPCWLAPLLGDPIVADLVIPAETNIGLVFCYDFAINIAPGTYIINTEAIPVIV